MQCQLLNEALLTCTHFMQLVDRLAPAGKVGMAKLAQSCKYFYGDSYAQHRLSN